MNNCGLCKGDVEKNTKIYDKDLEHGDINKPIGGDNVVWLQISRKVSIKKGWFKGTVDFLLCSDCHCSLQYYWRHEEFVVGFETWDLFKKQFLNSPEELLNIVKENSKIIMERLDDLIEIKKIEEEKKKNLKASIIVLLKKHETKMPTSDIDAHLKHQNVDQIKELCEEMYHDGEISRTGNYRYFILSKNADK